MTVPTNHLHPKLRLIDIQPTVQRGEPALLLRDPLQLSGHYVVLPYELGPALSAMAGVLDLAGIHQEVMASYGLVYPDGLLQHLVAVLDENLMLDNARATEAQAQALATYRAAPFRPPSLAGQSYPAEPAPLRRLFDGYLAQLNGAARAVPPTAGRALFSPHIDYHRGGPVYAAVWQQAAAMAQEADLVILLGTDHYSTGDRLTLTRQSYATPYGVLPTDTALVDALAAAIGPQVAFRGELRHRSEHSLELVATWLHHMRGGRPVAMLPILTGSFADFIDGQGDPASDAMLSAFVATLRQQAWAAGRQVLVVASGDLAHVGPAFGGAKLDAAGRAAIREADAELLQQLAAGSAEGFFAAIRRVEDRHNVCGVSPFYLSLRLLGDVEGQVAAYDQCPADQHNTSLVSVCGMVFG
jgi:AmmeMemoRadiSam system protein B